MNELTKAQHQDLFNINANTDRITVSARELHKFLEVGTQFKDWIHRMIEYGFEESIDFNPLKFEQVRLEGSREVKREMQDYQLTLDMAKELAMLQRNEKGKQARQYFIQIEKEWNSPEKVIARALVIANKQIEKLQLENKELKPKAEFFDAVANSKTAIQMGEVAKVLEMKGLGRNNLFEFLRKKGILQYNNLPYQKFVDCGYFRVIEQKYTKPSGETVVTTRTLVYQKGVNYIRKLIEKEKGD